MAPAYALDADCQTCLIAVPKLQFLSRNNIQTDIGLWWSSYHADFSYHSRLLQHDALILFSQETASHNIILGISQFTLPSLSYTK